MVSTLEQTQVTNGVSVLSWLAAPVTMFYGNLQRENMYGMLETQKSGDKTSSGEIW